MQTIFFIVIFFTELVASDTSLLSQNQISIIDNTFGIPNVPHSVLLSGSANQAIQCLTSNCHFKIYCKLISREDTKNTLKCAFEIFDGTDTFTYLSENELLWTPNLIRLRYQIDINAYNLYRVRQLSSISSNTEVKRKMIIDALVLNKILGLNNFFTVKLTAEL